MIELDLSNNFIKVTGATALKDMFKENSSLVNINLQYNKGIDTSLLSSINSAVAINSDPKAIKVDTQTGNKAVRRF